MSISWAPVEGSHNYTASGAAVVVNYATKGATVTPHHILGTPGTGKNRIGT